MAHFALIFYAAILLVHPYEPKQCARTSSVYLRYRGEGTHVSGFLLDASYMAHFLHTHSPSKLIDRLS
jgi:hypothetical protein